MSAEQHRATVSVRPPVAWATRAHGAVSRTAVDTTPAYAPVVSRLRRWLTGARTDGRLGALAERDFRLLFLGTTITTIGDRLAGIALAFAVLDRGSATALGIVFAVRQGVEACVVLFGGVLADRLPRNLVLVGASLVQGVAQARPRTSSSPAPAAVGRSSRCRRSTASGAGVVIPAEVGLVPQTVSDARLQQANALQGLTRNLVGVLGPAIGGALVVAGSPGTALAVDAVSFVVCAVAARADPARRPRRSTARARGSSTSCATGGACSPAARGCGRR